MSNYVWDERTEYLSFSREFMWNKDYFAFLVEKVWEINKPVNIVDFGCGLGFMGSMFLPLLPAGSTYTGIDKGGKLIDEARKRFCETGYSVNFIEADFFDINLGPQFDIAVCQTVLQHMPDALTVMHKMKSSVREGGMVLCIETDRNPVNAALYFDGIDYNELNTLGIMQKLWVNDRKQGKGDPNIGTKLPAYMRKIGLYDIGVRINDYVQFIDPLSDNEYHERNVRGFLRNGWSSSVHDKEATIASLVKRGLTYQEAEQQQVSEQSITDHLEHHINEICVFSTSFLVVAYGYKR